MSAAELSDDVQRQAATREKRWLWIYVGVIIAAGAVGASLVPLVTHRHVVGWWVTSITVALALFVVLLVFGLLWVLRRRGAPSFARSPLWEIGYSDRKLVAKAIRRATPVAPEHRDVAVRAARQIAARRWPFWLFGIVGLLYVVNAIFEPGWNRVLWIFCACLFFFYAGYHRWLTGRATQAVEVFGREPATER